MTCSADQIAQIEDRVANCVQRPLVALQAVFRRGTADDEAVLKAIANSEGLVAWARGLRIPPDQHV